MGFGQVANFAVRGLAAGAKLEQLWYFNLRRLY